MIKLRIGDVMISRVLVNGGAIRPIKTSLQAFNRAEVEPLGMIALPVYAADRMIEVKFLVVDTPSAMIVIMGR